MRWMDGRGGWSPWSPRWRRVEGGTCLLPQSSSKIFTPALRFRFTFTIIYIEYDFEMKNENHILYALYSRSSILLSQELHNNVFSGKNVAATPTDTDEVQKEELEEKNLEKVEDVEVVLERIRSLVVQVREKEEEGSK